MAFVLFIFASSAAALDPWTKTDTAFQAAVVATQIADWSQTRYAARSWNWKAEGRGNGTHAYYKENNPLLGEHPSGDKVDSYFAVSIVGNALVSAILPNPYRRIWQTISIVYEANVVRRNYQVGVRMRF